MTPQEIFDTVWHAMKAQGRQSLNYEGDCMYRGENGAKCAVGCLISDDEYTPDMDENYSGTDVRSLFTSGLLPELLAPHLSLLDSLQICHDAARDDFWGQFSARAKKVAKLRNLTIPENTQ